MMRASLGREVNRILALAGAAGLISIFVHSLWPLVLALAIYLGWSTRHLYLMYQWVMGRREDPPDNSGLWGDLSLRLEQIFRQKREDFDNLVRIIDRAQESVNALADGVILTDQFGHLEYWNDAAGVFLHFRRDKDQGQPLTNLIRNPAFHRYFNRGQFGEPLELHAPHDDNLILQFRTTEFGVGDRLMLVRDVTRLRNLEQMRKDFVANVSHELKTPLTVLKGYLETLLDTVPEDQTRLRRALLQMDQQSERMQLLVHDLLLLARLEATDADEGKEAVPLYGMLNRMREDALALAPGKHQTVEIDVPKEARLVGSPSELESCFGNLISNAVKYTGEGGHIRVRFWQDDQGAHLSVTDDGIGIDPTHIPRLTERFYRPDTSRVTRTGGTGLGLAIVKHVMIRHQGKLEIQSQPGKGSTFTCHFPPARLVRKPTAVAG